MKVIFKQSLAVLTAALMLLCILPTQMLTAEPEIWDGSIAIGFAGGSGTKNDPYLISNGAELAYLAQQVNGGVNYAGIYFKLNNNISLEGSEWIPIGNADNHFSGNFNGNGKAVTNLTVNDDQEDYHGLFGYSNGEIKNLSLLSGCVYGADCVGAVAGCNSGSIVGCYNMADVYGFENVGGLVGENAGTVTSCKNCANTVAGFHSVGGIAGNSADTGNIADCYNHGMLSYYTNYIYACDIKGGVHIKDATGQYGGIVGCNAGAVTGCRNEGMLGHDSYDMELGYAVGGVVGDNYGNIYCCSNIGAIYADGEVGGVVGCNAEDSIVSACFNMGEVSGYDMAVGGIAGYNEANVKDCYNRGNVDGYFDVGGLIGENCVSGSVTDCYNVGAVQAESNAGGAVGANEGSTESIYYLVTCCKNGNSYGVALTNTQMQNKASFAGFDFTSVWTMKGNPDYSYPELIDNPYESAPEADDIPIDEAHFPDANFRTWVFGNCDTDGNGYLSPAEAETTFIIDVSDFNIANLTGIEYFTALTRLSCYNNQLTQLDVSKNTALKDLDCSDNQLTSLDVSNNTALWDLDCGGNQLTQLDVSQNTVLAWLDCSNNQLTQLDVSNDTALTQLWCYSNQLKQLDVSNNTALTQLVCYYNQLKQLDVSNNTALVALYCVSNQLTNLNVNGATALELLYCSDNQLTSLDVSNNTALMFLNCSDNQLTSLDVSGATALESLNCSDNQLTELDVSKNTALTTLGCYDNQISEIDVSMLDALTVFYCQRNLLTSLDVSNNASLEKLSCLKNQLTSLDVSCNIMLDLLYCSDNQLTSLDVSKNTALRSLDCSGNQLTSLDLSANTELTGEYAEFTCNNNKYRVSSDPFDLTELPGNFDISKASNWQGATINDNILTFTADFATYTYDCGSGLSAKFRLLSPDYTTPPGDYDDDGEVNVQDAIMILRTAMNLIPGEVPAAADVNGDGKVNVQDAILALRIAMNLI